MSFRWSDEVVLITGASSGLGKALALGAQSLGATVIKISFYDFSCHGKASF